uniref:probable receptor-like protein kinase At2g23200 isoform X2 n=1 Tax=Fragaria vesca subsp. vesca TaxID=101020 RepID=UPI0005C8FA13|nr:PREDICTED: probable receptor-like protein kinase At2g23200 isoform X2 [Fragaria vesca subsp. vesca]
MEFFQKCRIHVHILLLFLLLFSNLHSLSFADNYYINCGSDANVSLTTGQNFVAESKSGSSFSKSNAIADTNQLSASLSALYQTARASSDPFYYEFKVTVGTYLVRLHFLAFFSTSSNLSAAVFDVLDSTKFTLLNNFSAKSSTSSPLIKEFFLRIDSTESFRLYFTPRASSLAFVNAIEFFAVPPDFTNFIPENFTSNNSPLQTIYRVNVGGPSNNDTLWRSWETDDTYLLDPNSAKETSKGILSRNNVGKFDGFVFSNVSVAPDWVYLTAKAMNINASRPANSSNITWSLRVRANARHIVRAHFCDIVGSAPGNVIFNLYSNGNIRKEVGRAPLSSVPFYYDFVVNSSASELINISIRPRNDSVEKNAFLNGLEILEIMEGKGSIPHVKVPMKNIVAVVVGSVLGGLFLICIVIAGFVFRLRHRKKEKGVETSVWSPMPANGGGSSHSSAFNLNYLGLKISFTEIQSATNNFDTKLVIGKGGFGNVYRGTPLNGTKVAVKRAYKRDEEGSSSGQGLSEFETEIIVLSKIRHRHLVSLIGYCNEGSEMILVYEFMEKGTLRDHLYNSDVPRLSWEQRLEICTGAARGLHYLHTGAAGGIIHRDVKSSNILLDQNHVAKVADFGLSKSGALNETHVSTNVKGTFGYLDPEYMMSQQLTEKSDVYSFGVVLLEVLCARPAIDSMLPREQMNLAEWGMFYQKRGLLEQIVDSALKGHIDPSSLRKFGETVEKCLQEDASDRPTMADVLWDLEYALRLQQTTKLREAHEDSTTIDASSAAFGLPNVQRIHSLGSTMNGDDIREDNLDTTESEIFSQLKIRDAR